MLLYKATQMMSSQKDNDFVVVTGAVEAQEAVQVSTTEDHLGVERTMYAFARVLIQSNQQFVLNAVK